MTIGELKEVLVKHEKWLNNEKGGKRADLHGADLRGVDLRKVDFSGANLRGANLRGASLREADLSGAELDGADLRGVNLYGSDLYWADLRGADLRGADLDFSCLPLWCGGSHFVTDPRIARQIIAHVCTLTIPDADDELKACLAVMRKEAVKSHRARDLGLIGEEE